LEIAAVDRLVAVQRALDAQFFLQNAIAGFLQTSEVGLREFQDFVRPLLHADSPLQAIGWAPLVAETSREAMELAARSEGLRDFKIIERDAGGAMIPALQRSVYAPVLYMEPIVGNEAAVGFDLLSEPVRHDVLALARDMGTLSTTHRLTLVQDQRSRSGFLSARAVYRRGAALDSVEQRRAALIGYVSAVFWVDDLIEIGLADLRPVGVDMYFF
jgi:CHASE1-domain containing sensor protein